MAAATPEVPSEMLTSSTPMLRPSDAMALSPPPGPTASAATSSSPPACSAASWNACHQASGFTLVPSGCLACPKRTISPVSASVTRTLVDWVDVSTPATRTLLIVPPCNMPPKTSG